MEPFTAWSPSHPIPDEAELRDPTTWALPDSRIESHRALRTRAGVTMPRGERQVLIFDTLAHAVVRETSLIATRDGDGRWLVDAVSESLVGTPDATTRHQRWMLSRMDGLALDGWLADSCVHAEPPRSTHSEIEWSGINIWTLETTGQQPEVLLQRHFSGFGRAYQIRSVFYRDTPIDPFP